MSIIIPLFLSGLRLSTECPEIIFGSRAKNSNKYKFFTFCLTPILRLLLNLKLHIYHLMETLNLGDEETYSKKSEIKFYLRSMEKLELGLETVNQLSIQMVLLLNALTETRISEGFNVIFKDGSNLWSSILLSLSILWSFCSCSMTHLKGLMIRRDHFPAMSKMTAALLAVVSICKRVSCIVIYFTSPLGLFNILRHLQAEQTRYYFAFDNKRLV